jgi:hypothetical protein
VLNRIENQFKENRLTASGSGKIRIKEEYYCEYLSLIEVNDVSVSNLFFVKS